MATSRFTHSTGIVKSLAAAALVSAAVCGTASAGESGSPLTPAMQTCLRAALITETITPQMPLHADEDTPEARGRAMVGRIVKACDVRGDEFVAVRDFFQNLSEEMHRKPDAPRPSEQATTQPVPQATKKSGQREIPLCVGNCR